MPRAYPQRDIGRVSVVTAPTSAPIPTAEVKAHLRIDHDGEDTQLDDYLSAAVGEIDSPHGWLGRSLITRTLRLTLDAYPPRIIYLPGPPVTAVKTITVRDGEDNTDIIFDADTAVDLINLMSDFTAEPALIWADDNIGWPSDIKGGVDSMRIDYVAGYAVADLPKTIRQWLLMRTGELYRDREASMLGIPSTRLYHADRMLDGLRVRQ